MNDIPPEAVPTVIPTAQPSPPPAPASLELRRHHDISGFASEDETRYVLRFVRYNAEAKRLEATDGRVLAMVPYSEPGPKPETGLIPAEALGKFLRKLPKSSKCPPAQIAHVAIGAEKVVFRQEKEGEANTTVVTVDDEWNGKFPTVDNVIPQYGSSAPSVTLGPRYVKAIADYAMKYGKPNGSIRFTLGPEDSACDIRVELEGNEEARFILMPLRLPK